MLPAGSSSGLPPFLALRFWQRREESGDELPAWGACRELGEKGHLRAHLSPHSFVLCCCLCLQSQACHCAWGHWSCSFCLRPLQVKSSSPALAHTAAFKYTTGSTGCRKWIILAWIFHLIFASEHTAVLCVEVVCCLGSRATSHLWSDMMGSAEVDEGWWWWSQEHHHCSASASQEQYRISQWDIYIYIFFARAFLHNFMPTGTRASQAHAGMCCWSFWRSACGLLRGACQQPWVFHQARGYMPFWKTRQALLARNLWCDSVHIVPTCCITRHFLRLYPSGTQSLNCFILFWIIVLYKSNVIPLLCVSSKYPARHHTWMYLETSFLVLRRGCFMEQLVTVPTGSCRPRLHLD